MTPATTNPIPAPGISAVLLFGLRVSSFLNEPALLSSRYARLRVTFVAHAAAASPHCPSRQIFVEIGRAIRYVHPSTIRATAEWQRFFDSLKHHRRRPRRTRNAKPSE